MRRRETICERTKASVEIKASRRDAARHRRAIGEVMRPGAKRWTAEEDNILRQEALAGSPVSEIASRVGRTESGVRTRAYTLRILLRQVGLRRRDFGAS